MQIGDKVKINPVHTASTDNTIYVVLDINEESVKVQHPTIAGYFVFSRSLVFEVINEHR